MKNIYEMQENHNPIMNYFLVDTFSRVELKDDKEKD